MNTIKLNVKGMTCGGCKLSVTKGLQAVPGVAAVDVSLEAGSATVTYDTSKASVDDLKAAVEKAGFTAA